MKFLLRLSILILTPLLLLGALYLYVLVRSPRPDSAPLVRTADRRMVLTGETVEVSLHLNGDKILAAPVPGTAEAWTVMLVIDHSGSMGSGFGSPLENAKQAAGYFARVVAGPKQPVGVIAFDDHAQVYHPIERDGEACAQAILSIASGGGTDIAGAVAAAHRELKKGVGQIGDPAARGMMVLLSDGASPPAPAEAAAESAKADGVRIVTIGLGTQVNEDLLRRIASSEADFHYTIDSAALGDVYTGIAGEMSPVIGRSGLLSEKYHYDGFSLVNPIAGFQTAGDPGDGSLAVSLPVLFAQRVRFPYTVRAQKSGLYGLALQPAELSFLPDSARPEQTETLSSALTPPVIIVSPLLLLLLFSPALGFAAWRLAMLLAKPLAAAEPPPKATAYPVPPPIPLPPPATVKARTPQPTLFVGLGRTGRDLLGRLVSGLSRDRFLEENPEPPFFFLQVDGLTDPPAAGSDPRFQVALAQLPGLVSERSKLESGELPAHLDWLPAKEVREAGNAELDLTEGSKGNRWVSRWSLFSALNHPARELGGSLERIANWCEAQQSGRVVVAASVESGSGGILLDTAYLIHSVLTSSTKVRARFPVYLLAIADLPAAHAAAGANQAAFLQELERFQIAAQIPTRMTYLPGATGSAAFLDGTLQGRFCDRVFLIQARQADDVPEIAQLLQTFTEQSFSRHLQGHLDRMRGQEQEYEREYAEATVHSARFFEIRFPAHEIARRLSRRFVMEVLGTGRLAGVRSDSEGGGLSLLPFEKTYLGEAMSLWPELDRFKLGGADSQGTLFYRAFCGMVERGVPVGAGSAKLPEPAGGNDLAGRVAEARRFALAWFERFLNGSPEVGDNERALWRRHRITHLHLMLLDLERFGREALERLPRAESESAAGLVAGLNAFHASLAGLTGQWLERLLDRGLTSGASGEKEAPSGLYRRANDEYLEIGERLEREKASPWRLLLDQEADGPDWAEDNLYQKHLGGYLRDELGFLPRWHWRFEGVEDGSPSRLSLELSAAETRKYTPRESDALYEALLQIAQGRLAELEAKTLYDRLGLKEGLDLKPLLGWFKNRVKQAGIEFDPQRRGAHLAQRSALVLAPEGEALSAQIAEDLHRLLDCDVKLSPHYDPQTLAVLLIDSVVPVRGIRLRTPVEANTPLPFVHPAERLAEKIREEIEARGVAKPCPSFHPLIKLLLAAPTRRRDWLAVAAEDCLVEEFDFSHHGAVLRLQVDGHAEIVAEPGEEPKLVWALLYVAHDLRGATGLRALLSRWHSRSAQEKVGLLREAVGRIRARATSAGSAGELLAQVSLLLELESRLIPAREGGRDA